jgi:hypothetical protein
MPANVDFSSVFDNVLPIVYIRKISLLEGEVDSNKLDPNEEAEPLRMEKNVYGKTKIKSNKKKASRPESSRALTVKVDLMIKDGVAQNGKSIWFDSDDAHKYLKIRVILCKDGKLGQRLLNGGLTEKVLKRHRKEKKFVEKTISIKKPSSDPLINQKMEIIGGKRAYGVPYSVSFTIDEYYPRHLSAFAMTIMHVGDAVVDRQAFTKRSRNIIQGNAMAEIVIDNGSVKKSAFVMRTPKNKIWGGPIHFHKKRGWMAGAFHSRGHHPALREERVPNFVVDDFRLLKEADKAELQLFPDVLEERERKKNKGERAKSSEFNKIVKKEKYVSELYSSRSPSNASNSLFHIDYEKLIRFETQFGKLLEIVDEQAKLSILAKSRIKNLRIFRHRVKPGLRKNEFVDVDFEERTELIAMASEKSAGFLPLVKREGHPDNPDLDSDAKLIGAIKEVPIHTANQIRSFAVSDYDMSRRTDGVYQYSLKLEIEDGTLEFVKEQLNKLIKARKTLQEYYNRTLIKVNYDFKTDGFNLTYQGKLAKDYPTPSRIDAAAGTKLDRVKLAEEGIAVAPWIRPITVYVDTLFNLSTLESEKSLAMSSLLYRLCNPTTGTSSGILMTIELLMSLESKIKRALGARHKVIDELDFVGRPSIQMGKAAKPMIVIDHRFRQAFDSDILKGVGYRYMANPTRKFVGPRQMSIDRYRGRVTQETRKHFSNAVATGKAAKVRADMLTTRASYLSPLSVSLGKSRTFKFFGSPAIWNRKYYEQIISSIMTMKPAITAKGKDKLNPTPLFYTAWDSTKETILSREENIVNTTNSVALSAFGVSIESPERFKDTLSFERTSEKREKKDTRRLGAEDILGENMQIVTDTIEQDDDVIVENMKPKHIEEEADFSGFTSSLIGKFAKSKSNLFGISEPAHGKVESIKNFNLQHDGNIIDRFLDLRARVISRQGSVPRPPLTKEGILARMPNQIKSIFYTKRSFTNRNWTNEPFDLFSDPRCEGLIYFNYKMLNRVEVLLGHKKSDITGEIMLASPRFRLLTDDILEEAMKKNRTLFCRMRPYENNILDFKHNPKLSLPVFDEYFILSPRKAARTEEALEAEADVDRGNMIYINRITEQGDLNNSGFLALKNIVQTSIVERIIEPEYVCTAMIQQPLRATKFGTKFGTRKMKKDKKSGGGGSVEGVLDTVYSDTSPSSGPSSKSGGPRARRRGASRGRGGPMGDKGGSY